MSILGQKNIKKRIIGVVSQKDCPYCKTFSNWELCTAKTWLTLFSIPLFPYKNSYCIACESCGHCLEIDIDTFIEIESQILLGTPRTEPESLKYINKNEIQINYIKTLQYYKH